MRTTARTDPAQFEAYLRTEPDVAQVWRVAADIDAVVRVSCASLADLDAVVGRMRHLGGAAETVTYLVLPSPSQPWAPSQPPAQPSPSQPLLPQPWQPQRPSARAAGGVPGA